MAKTTDEIVQHHIEALLAEDIDEILTDYEETSIIFTPQGPVQGKANLRKLFSDFLTALPDGTLQQLHIIRQDVQGEAAYMLWQAGENIPLGTDTMLVRHGKIAMQSYAAYF